MNKNILSESRRKIVQLTSRCDIHDRRILSSTMLVSESHTDLIFRLSFHIRTAAIATIAAKKQKIAVLARHLTLLKEF